MQATGAEMLRLAIVRLVDAGIRVAAPVHDALVVLAPLDELEATVHTARETMIWAGERVLHGFRLRVDAPQVVQAPDRYRDPDGVAMWNRVRQLLLKHRGVDLESVSDA
jgi:hypothetical protein